MTSILRKSKIGKLMIYLDNVPLLNAHRQYKEDYNSEDVTIILNENIYIW